MSIEVKLVSTQAVNIDLINTLHLKSTGLKPHGFDNINMFLMNHLNNVGIYLNKQLAIIFDLKPLLLVHPYRKSDVNLKSTF